jgi:hypothetical protein
MPPVWFTLVDSEGHPYNQSKVGKVQITDAEADITDLLAAVWSQCKDIFTGSRISVINLEVYLNREAFDKKERHLGEDHPIDGLGSSKQEAVVILVPSLESLSARGLIPSSLFLCCYTAQPNVHCILCMDKVYEKAHAHCDCCEAMHACVGVCV